MVERPLSQVEEQAPVLVFQGYTNHEIALQFNRSRRTIEVHRSHIM
ncbi:LuxR C-terminal-related transcriptional regulator [Anaerobaca lacustris]